MVSQESQGPGQLGLVSDICPPSPWQLPVAGAPGLHGVLAAKAVTWAFDGASEQARHHQLPLGVPSAKVPT